MKKEKVSRYDNLTEEQLRKKKKYIEIQVILLTILVVCSIAANAIFWIPTIEDMLYPPLTSTVSVKPIIYIYTEKEQEVEIKLSNPEKLTVTYPKYIDKWNVIARPNGDLTDLKTGRNLYSLYWEGKNTSVSDMKEGFIVEGKDTIKFLEEKLEILGLNEREAEEFIVYWLPKMEGNKYNYIYFQTMTEIEKNMKLEITPKPETLIRVLMEFKPLDKKIEVKEQQLEKKERKGYTVVEWGGTPLDE